MATAIKAGHNCAGQRRKLKPKLIHNEAQQTN